MVTIIVDSFDTWREKARALLQAGADPDQVNWSSGSDSLFSEGEPEAPSAGIAAPRVPKNFLPLAEEAACYRNSQRWSFLYRVLWRLNHHEPHLLEIASDPDVIRLRRMASEVHRDVHKMHAFVLTIGTSSIRPG